MITVDGCCCFNLETGVLVIGWLYFIGHILGSIVLALGIFASVKCLNNESEAEGCQILGEVTIGLFAVFIVMSIAFAYIAWRCINGTKERDHSKLKPMMIVLAISAVLSVLNILSFSATGAVQGLIGFAINGYFFVVIYSLYSVFRREREGGGNNRPDHQYQFAGKV